MDIPILPYRELLESVNGHARIPFDDHLSKASGFCFFNTQLRRKKFHLLKLMLMKSFLIVLSQNLLGQELERAGPEVQRLGWVEGSNSHSLPLTNKENKLRPGVVPVGGFLRCLC